MPGELQSDPVQAAPETAAAPRPRRLWISLAAFLVLASLAILPPYISMNRYQRRITASMSESLGRPVHLDHVTLNLLPIPGFTVDNFVVSEDPAFGSEPTIRAATVKATLRVSSLWRRRIEFGTISLADPSINLVHNAHGQWNLESILLQAARIDAAPTAQRGAGATPRFPYIEATGARVNLKLDVVKTPFSLTEADLALWLPSAETWHVRIAARPARTDVASGYPGLIRLDGTLVRARTFTEIPIDLHGEWRTAPLGEVTRLFLGRDAGWRGEVSMTASILGTIGNNQLHTRIHVEDVRRAEFVPAKLLPVTLECVATIADAFHSLPSAQCAVPARSSEQSALSVSGSIGDIRTSKAVLLKAVLPPTPGPAVVDVLRTLSPRTPANLNLAGTLSGTMTYQASPAIPPSIDGSLILKGGAISTDPEDKTPIQIGDATLETSQGTSPTNTPASGISFTLLPATLALGAREPAILSGHFDHDGYTLRLTGSAIPERLKALAAAIPQLGDSLADALPASATPGTAPLRLALTSTRTWGSAQTWHTDAQRPAESGSPRSHRPSRRPRN